MTLQTGRYSTRGATVVVAAADAGWQWRNNADFVAGGGNAGAVINRALAQAQATGSREAVVLLSDGTFELEQRIVIAASGIRLVGAGMRQTVLRLADGANTNVMLIAAPSGRLSGVSIEGMTIDGNGVNQTDGATVEARSGIYFFGQYGAGADDLLIRDVYVYGCRGMGMSLDGTATATLRRLRLDRVHSNGNGNAGWGFACDGIHVAYGEDVKVVAVHAEANTDTGLAFDYCTRALVVASVARGNLSNQFTAARASKYVTYVGCTADGADVGAYGFRTGKFGDGGAAQSQDLQIYGCRAVNNVTAGLKIDDHLILQANMYCPGSGADGNGTALETSNSSILVFGSGNIGVTAHAAGTGTVASGQTSVNVTHGLNATLAALAPLALKHIVVTPTNNPTNNVRYWVSAVSSTQFTVTTSGDPGASGLGFAWQVRVDV